MDSRHPHWCRIALGLAACMWVGSAVQDTLAQQFKEVPKAITDPRQVNQLRREVSSIVRGGGALSADDQKTLQNYYVMHIIAGMTQNAVASDPAQFPNWRKIVVGDLSVLSGSAQKHTFLRNLIYSYALRLAKDKGYSPAARYNALLLLAELNERESQGSGRSVTPAVPFARARKDLLEFANSNDSEEIKVGALLGLARHARLLAAAGSRPDADLTRQFVTVLQADPAGEGSDGQMWMKRIAIDALGDIGQPGAVKFIVPILVDSSQPIMLRCAAADALGRMDYRNAQDLNAAQMLTGLGQLAADSLAEQIRSLQEYIKENPVDAVMEARARSPEDKEVVDPVSTRVRRVLKHELTCVGRGLRALQQTTADAPMKNAITALLSEIGAVIKELNDETVLPHELFEKIGPPAIRVESAVKNVAPA